MKFALQCVALFAASIGAAAGALAQEPAVPAGNWQSAASETITSALHPILTGGELYLKIDVSNDGSFRGEWGEPLLRRVPFLLLPVEREHRARFRQVRSGS